MATKANGLRCWCGSGVLAPLPGGSLEFLSWKAEWQLTATASDLPSTAWPPFLPLGESGQAVGQLRDPEDTKSSWEKGYTDVCLFPRTEEAYSSGCGANWLRRKRSLASVICQLVESDDTLRTIFFESMSSRQLFCSQALPTSSHLPGLSPFPTSGEELILLGSMAPLPTKSIVLKKPGGKSHNIAWTPIFRTQSRNALKIWQGQLAPWVSHIHSQVFPSVFSDVTLRD